MTRGDGPMTREATEKVQMDIRSYFFQRALYLQQSQ